MGAATAASFTALMTRSVRSRSSVSRSSPSLRRESSSSSSTSSVIRRASDSMRASAYSVVGGRSELS
ncbi:Uncharacterised protein [Mycobacterium tuberculosis]|uniref:Uncharacterized protein n=1 Tax=Mycobacterium tuberculosis TaxID=1773 RepID=A0A916LAJ4_MYCTX|nr:Uncharacterised protein [Mycobacterium tuberculosis]COX87730.1 Uncharacterised protein [Mycobacterium tuberculosis]